MNLKEQWNELIALRSFDNKVIGEILFHILIGQKFKKCRIVFGSKEKEVRVSTVIFSPTRTGKGEATDVLIDVADHIGVSTKIETETTTAAVVGTINRAAMENNIKKNLQTGDEGYIDPVVVGDLGKYDIIIFKEAKGLIKPTGTTERLLDVTQEALDDGGYICKTLAGGNGEDIDYTSSASVVATSYMLKEQIREVVTTQGFFQRLIVYAQPVNFENRKVRRKNILSAYQIDNREKYNQLKKKFVEQIEKIKMENTSITVSKEAITFIDKKMSDFEETLEKSFQGQILDVIGGFVISTQDMFFKLSAHYAIIDGRNVIEIKDAGRAFPLIKSTSSSIINELLSNVSYDIDDKKFDAILRRIYTKGDEEFTKTQLQMVLADTLKVGLNSALKLINNLIDGKYLVEEKRERNTKVLKLKK